MTIEDYKALKSKYDRNTELAEILKKKQANIEKQLADLEMKRLNQFTVLRNFEKNHK